MKVLVTGAHGLLGSEFVRACEERGWPVAALGRPQLDVTDADGFQFAPTYYAPDYYRTIVDLLVPELQRRGRVRTGYTGGTLRENLLG